jgi:predicted nucleic acid-binding protein
LAADADPQLSTRRFPRRGSLIIVDTNVLIGGLPTVNGPGTLARILDGMLDGSIGFIVSDALLSEYRAVLVRPALLARLRMTPAAVDQLIDRLARTGITVQPVPAPPAPDPGDQMLWELLEACPESRLVTRDELLVRKGRMRKRVIRPEAFEISAGIKSCLLPLPGKRLAKGRI